ncbi:L,D-transpeptidase family protein [Candidatus Pelagibacter sp.]|nr:L,D-transpeptidase family protein [Candidatus Pelagibacter sp.]
MTIIIKNKDTLIYDDFEFKCCVGKNGFTKSKIEGDGKTPRGRFSLGDLYYRKDKKHKPNTKLKIIEIKKNMGWCNDIKLKDYYNKLTNLNPNIKGERLFRKDYKYDFFIPIKYNWKNPTPGKGSAIFIHLTKNFKSTAGCIAMSEKDFLILIKLIKKNTKIKIL